MAGNSNTSGNIGLSISDLIQQLKETKSDVNTMVNTASSVQAGRRAVKQQNKKTSQNNKSTEKTKEVREIEVKENIKVTSDTKAAQKSFDDLAKSSATASASIEKVQDTTIKLLNFTQNISKDLVQAFNLKTIDEFINKIKQLENEFKLTQEQIDTIATKLTAISDKKYPDILSAIKSNTKLLESPNRTNSEKVIYKQVINGLAEIYKQQSHTSMDTVLKNSSNATQSPVITKLRNNAVAGHKQRMAELEKLLKPVAQQSSLPTQIQKAVTEHINENIKMVTEAKAIIDESDIKAAQAIIEYKKSMDKTSISSYEKILGMAGKIKNNDLRFGMFEKAISNHKLSQHGDILSLISMIIQNDTKTKQGNQSHDEKVYEVIKSEIGKRLNNMASSTNSGIDVKKIATTYLNQITNQDIKSKASSLLNFASKGKIGISNLKRFEDVLKQNNTDTNIEKQAESAVKATEEKNEKIIASTVTAVEASNKSTEKVLDDQKKTAQKGMKIIKKTNTTTTTPQTVDANNTLQKADNWLQLAAKEVIDSNKNKNVSMLDEILKEVSKEDATLFEQLKKQKVLMDSANKQWNEYYNKNSNSDLSNDPKYEKIKTTRHNAEKKFDDILFSIKSGKLRQYGYMNLKFGRFGNIENNTKELFNKIANGDIQLKQNLDFGMYDEEKILLIIRDLFNAYNKNNIKNLNEKSLLPNSYTGHVDKKISDLIHNFFMKRGPSAFTNWADESWKYLQFLGSLFTKEERLNIKRDENDYYIPNIDKYLPKTVWDSLEKKHRSGTLPTGFIKQHSSLSDKSYSDSATDNINKIDEKVIKEINTLIEEQNTLAQIKDKIQYAKNGNARKLTNADKTKIAKIDEQLNTLYDAELYKYMDITNPELANTLYMNRRFAPSISSKSAIALGENIKSGKINLTSTEKRLLGNLESLRSDVSYVTTDKSVFEIWDKQLAEINTDDSGIVNQDLKNYLKTIEDYVKSNILFKRLYQKKHNIDSFQWRTSPFLKSLNTLSVPSLGLTNTELDRIEKGQTPLVSSQQTREVVSAIKNETKQDLTSPINAAFKELKGETTKPTQLALPIKEIAQQKAEVVQTIAEEVKKSDDTVKNAIQNVVAEETKQAEKEKQEVKKVAEQKSIAVKKQSDILKREAEKQQEAIKKIQTAKAGATHTVLDAYTEEKYKADKPEEKKVKTVDYYLPNEYKKYLPTIEENLKLINKFKKNKDNLNIFKSEIMPQMLSYASEKYSTSARSQNIVSVLNTIAKSHIGGPAGSLETQKKLAGIFNYNDSGRDEFGKLIDSDVLDQVEKVRIVADYFKQVGSLITKYKSGELQPKPKQETSVKTAVEDTKTSVENIAKTSQTLDEYANLSDKQLLEKLKTLNAEEDEYFKVAHEIRKRTDLKNQKNVAKQANVKNIIKNINEGNNVVNELMALSDDQIRQQVSTLNANTKEYKAFKAEFDRRGMIANPSIDYKKLERGDKNKSVQDIMDTFALRNVAIEDIVKKSYDSQELLNTIYDNMLNMSKVTGIDPKMLGAGTIGMNIVNKSALGSKNIAGKYDRFGKVVNVKPDALLGKNTQFHEFGHSIADRIASYVYGEDVANGKISHSAIQNLLFNDTSLQNRNVDKNTLNIVNKMRNIVQTAMSAGGLDKMIDEYVKTLDGKTFKTEQGQIIGGKQLSAYFKAPTEVFQRLFAQYTGTYDERQGGLIDLDGDTFNKLIKPLMDSLFKDMNTTMNPMTFSGIDRKTLGAYLGKDMAKIVSTKKASKSGTEATSNTIIQMGKQRTEEKQRNSASIIKSNIAQMTGSVSDTFANNVKGTMANVTSFEDAVKGVVNSCIDSFKNAFIQAIGIVADDFKKQLSNGIKEAMNSVFADGNLKSAIENLNKTEKQIAKESQLAVENRITNSKGTLIETNKTTESLENESLSIVTNNRRPVKKSSITARPTETINAIVFPDISSLANGNSVVTSTNITNSITNTRASDINKKLTDVSMYNIPAKDLAKLRKEQQLVIDQNVFGYNVTGKTQKQYTSDLQKEYDAIATMKKELDSYAQQMDYAQNKINNGTNQNIKITQTDIDNFNNLRSSVNTAYEQIRNLGIVNQKGKIDLSPALRTVTNPDNTVSNALEFKVNGQMLESLMSSISNVSTTQNVSMFESVKKAYENEALRVSRIQNVTKLGSDLMSDIRNTVNIPGGGVVSKSSFLDTTQIARINDFRNGLLQGAITGINDGTITTKEQFDSVLNGLKATFDELKAMIKDALTVGKDMVRSENETERARQRRITQNNQTDTSRNLIDTNSHLINTRVEDLNKRVRDFVRTFNDDVTLRDNTITKRGQVQFAGLNGQMVTAQLGRFILSSQLDNNGQQQYVTPVARLEEYISQIQNLSRNLDTNLLRETIQNITNMFDNIIKNVNQNINNQLKQTNSELRNASQTATQERQNARQQASLGSIAQNAANRMAIQVDEFERSLRQNVTVRGQQGLRGDIIMGTGAHAGISATGTYQNAQGVQTTIAGELRNYIDAVRNLNTQLSPEEFRQELANIGRNFKTLLSETNLAISNAIKAETFNGTQTRQTQQLDVTNQRRLTQMQGVQQRFEEYMLKQVNVGGDRLTYEQLIRQGRVTLPANIASVDEFRNRFNDIINNINGGAYNGQNGITSFMEAIHNLTQDLNSLHLNMKQYTNDLERERVQNRPTGVANIDALRAQAGENLNNRFTRFTNWLRQGETIGNQVVYRGDIDFLNPVTNRNDDTGYLWGLPMLQQAMTNFNTQAFNPNITRDQLNVLIRNTNTLFDTIINTVTNGVTQVVTDNRNAVREQEAAQRELNRQMAQSLSSGLHTANMTETRISRIMRNPTMNTMFMYSGDPYLRGNVRIRLSDEENRAFRDITTQLQNLRNELTRTVAGETAAQTLQRRNNTNREIADQNQRMQTLIDNIADRSRPTGIAYNEYQEVVSPWMQMFAQNTGFNLFRHPNERAVNWETLGRGFTSGNRGWYALELAKFINFPTLRQAFGTLFNQIQAMATSVARAITHAFNRVLGIIRTVGSAITRIALGITGVVAGLTTGAVAGVTAGIAALGRSVVNATDEFRKMTIALSGVYKSPAKTSRMIQMAYTASSNLPMNYSDAVKTLNEISAIPAVQKILKSPNEEKSRTMLDKMFKILSAMTTMRPDKSTSDAVFSLRNALAGDLRSLQRRFDLPVNSMTNPSGSRGLGKVKNDPMKMLGSLESYFDSFIDMETLNRVSMTISTTMDKITGAFKIFRTTIGEAGLYDLVLEDVLKLKDAILGMFDSDFGKNLAVRFSDAFGNIYESIRDMIMNVNSALYEAFDLGSIFETEGLGDADSIAEEYINSEVKTVADMMATITESVAKTFRFISSILSKENILTAIKSVVNYVKQIDFETIINSITDGIVVLYNRTVDLFKEITDSIKSIKQTLNRLGITDKAIGRGVFFTWLFGAGNIASVIRSTFGIAWGLINTFLATIGTTINLAMTAFLVKGTAAFAGLGTALGGIMITVTEITAGIAAIAAGVYLIVHNFDRLREICHNLWSTIQSVIKVVFKSVWLMITEPIKAFVGDAIAMVTIPFTAIKDHILNIWDAIRDIFGSENRQFIIDFFTKTFDIVTATLKVAFYDALGSIGINVSKQKEEAKTSFNTALYNYISKPVTETDVKFAKYLKRFDEINETANNSFAEHEITPMDYFGNIALPAVYHTARSFVRGYNTGAKSFDTMVDDEESSLNRKYERHQQKYNPDNKSLNFGIFGDIANSLRPSNIKATYSLFKELINNYMNENEAENAKSYDWDLPEFSLPTFEFNKLNNVLTDTNKNFMANEDALKAMAAESLKVANNMKLTGTCAAGVKTTLSNLGFMERYDPLLKNANNIYEELTNGQNRTSLSKYFKEVKLKNKSQDLINLPIGTLLSYGPSKSNKYGHIEIITGYNKASSDHTHSLLNEYLPNGYDLSKHIVGKYSHDTKTHKKGDPHADWTVNNSLKNGTYSDVRAFVPVVMPEKMKKMLGKTDTMQVVNTLKQKETIKNIVEGLGAPAAGAALQAGGFLNNVYGTLTGITTSIQKTGENLYKHYTPPVVHENFVTALNGISNNLNTIISGQNSVYTSGYNLDLTNQIFKSEKNSTESTVGKAAIMKLRQTLVEETEKYRDEIDNIVDDETYISSISGYSERVSKASATVKEKLDMLEREIERTVVYSTDMVSDYIANTKLTYMQTDMENVINSGMRKLQKTIINESSVKILERYQDAFINTDILTDASKFLETQIKRGSGRMDNVYNSYKSGMMYMNLVQEQAAKAGMMDYEDFINKLNDTYRIISETMDMYGDYINRIAVIESERIRRTTLKNNISKMTFGELANGYTTYVTDSSKEVRKAALDRSNAIIDEGIEDVSLDDKIVIFRDTAIEAFEDITTSIKNATVDTVKSIQSSIKTGLDNFFMNKGRFHDVFHEIGKILLKNIANVQTTKLANSFTEAIVGSTRKGEGLLGNLFGFEGAVSNEKQDVKYPDFLQKDNELKHAIADDTREITENSIAIENKIDDIQTTLDSINTSINDISTSDFQKIYDYAYPLKNHPIYGNKTNSKNSKVGPYLGHEKQYVTAINNYQKQIPVKQLPLSEFENLYKYAYGKSPIKTTYTFSNQVGPLLGYEKEYLAITNKNAELMKKAEEVKTYKPVDGGYIYDNRIIRTENTKKNIQKNIGSEIASITPDIASITPDIASASQNIASASQNIASASQNIASASSEIASITPAIASITPDIASASQIVIKDDGMYVDNKKLSEQEISSVKQKALENILNMIHTDIKYIGSGVTSIPDIYNYMMRYGTLGLSSGEIIDFKSFNDNQEKLIKTMENVSEGLGDPDNNSNLIYTIGLAKPGKPIDSRSLKPRFKEMETLKSNLNNKVYTQYDEYIENAAKKYNVNKAVVKGLIMTESSFDPVDESNKGAVGLMQLMPKTAVDLGLKGTDVDSPSYNKTLDERYDVQKNIDAGVKYLKQMYDQAVKENYANPFDVALASYNFGPGNVRKPSLTIPDETMTYLDNVKGFAKVFNGGEDVSFSYLENDVHDIKKAITGETSITRSGVTENELLQPNLNQQIYSRSYNLKPSQPNLTVNEIMLAGLGGLTKQMFETGSAEAVPQVMTAVIGTPMLGNVINNTASGGFGGLVSSSISNAILGPSVSKQTSGGFGGLVGSSISNAILGPSVSKQTSGSNISGKISKNIIKGAFKNINNIISDKITFFDTKGGTTSGSSIGSLVSGLVKGGSFTKLLTGSGVVADSVLGMEGWAGANSVVKSTVGLTSTLFGKKAGASIAKKLVGTKLGAALPVIGTVAAVLSQKGWFGGAKDRTAEGRARGAEFNALRDSLVANRNTMARNYYMANDDTLEAMRNYEFGTVAMWTSKRGSSWKGTKRRIMNTDATAFTNSMQGYWDLLQKATEEANNNQRKLDKLANINNLEALRQTGAKESTRLASIADDLAKYEAAVSRYAGHDTGFTQTLFDGQTYTMTQLNDKVQDLIKELGDSKNTIAQNTEAIRQEKLATADAKLDYETALYGKYNPLISQQNEIQKLKNEWNSVMNDDGTIGYKEGTKEWYQWSTKMLQATDNLEEATKQLEESAKQFKYDVANNWVSTLTQIRRSDGTYSASQVKNIANAYRKKVAVDSVGNSLESMMAGLNPTEMSYTEDIYGTKDVYGQKSVSAWDKASPYLKSALYAKSKLNTVISPLVLRRLTTDEWAKYGHYLTSYNGSNSRDIAQKMINNMQNQIVGYQQVKIGTEKYKIGERTYTGTSPIKEGAITELYNTLKNYNKNVKNEADKIDISKYIDTKKETTTTLYDLSTGKFNEANFNNDIQKSLKTTEGKNALMSLGITADTSFKELSDKYNTALKANPTTQISGYYTKQQYQNLLKKEGANLRASGGYYNGKYYVYGTIADTATKKKNINTANENYLNAIQAAGYSKNSGVLTQKDGMYLFNAGGDVGNYQLFKFTKDQANQFTQIMFGKTIDSYMEYAKKTVTVDNMSLKNGIKLSDLFKLVDAGVMKYSELLGKELEHQIAMANFENVVGDIKQNITNVMSHTTTSAMDTIKANLESIKIVNKNSKDFLDTGDYTGYDDFMDKVILPLVQNIGGEIQNIAGVYEQAFTSGLMNKKDATGAMAHMNDFMQKLEDAQYAYIVALESGNSKDIKAAETELNKLLNANSSYFKNLKNDYTTITKLLYSGNTRTSILNSLSNESDYTTANAALKAFNAKLGKNAMKDLIGLNGNFSNATIAAMTGNDNIKNATDNYEMGFYYQEQLLLTRIANATKYSEEWYNAELEYFNLLEEYEKYKTSKAERRTNAIGNILNNISNDNDYSIANTTMQEFNKALGKDAVNKFIGLNGEFSAKTIAAMTGDKSIGTSSDPAQMYYEYQKNELIKTIKKSKEGSEEWYQAETELWNLMSDNARYLKNKAESLPDTIDKVLGSMSGYDDYTIANSALTEFNKALGKDALNKLVGGKKGLKEFTDANIAQWFGVSGEDPYETYYEYQKKTIMDRIKNEKEGSEEWYEAELDLWNLMMENAKYLKEKAEKTTETIEQMLGRIEETAKMRVAEEAKSQKGDIIFFDLGASRDGTKFINSMLKAIKSNDPEAQKLVEEFRKKKIGA